MNTTPNDYGPTIIKEFNQSIHIKQLVIANQISILNEIIRLLIRTFQNGKKVILFGNGGSAADCQHFAAELVCKFKQQRKALTAIALTTDTSILTSIANDYGFGSVFSRQIEALGQTGDVAIGVSTSGNSPNVLEGISTASRMGMITVGFTGQDGGRLKDCVDICFQVPSQITARIQEVHITAAHAICEIIECEFC